jgi:hypothetical protein
MVRPMSNRGSFWQRTFSFVFSEAALQAFWTYGAPPLFAALTAVVGLIEHEPLMYAITAAAVVFAAMSGGLLWFSLWRYQRTPEHKLVYARMKVNRGNGEAKKLASMGFILKNNALFPIEISITKLDTVLAARVSETKTLLLQQIYSVDAGNEFSYNDTVIDITGVTDTIMKGSMEFEVQYGRSGGRRYTLGQALIVFVPVDAAKPFVSGIRAADNQMTQPGG